MAKETDVLWIGSGPAPDNVREAADAAGALRTVRPEDVSREQLSGATVALLDDAPVDGIAPAIQALADAGIVGIVLGGQGNSPTAETLLRAPADLGADALAVMVTTAATLGAQLRGLRTEVVAARKAAKHAAETADEIDEEMRLAQRLQRDFLPRRLPTVGPIRFAAYYRPASWVSGDIYDVSRLDETHVGFYVADAVGHGMPAALLTMFIKKALETKRISGNSYEILPPHVSIQQLNADICAQKLSMCEFCTALYGVIDTNRLTLTFCRAGHPEPFLFHADGGVEQLAAPGGLLGILDEASYESRNIQLVSGDRLVVYSDGTEDTICGKGDQRTGELIDAIRPIGQQNREDMLLTLSQWVEQRVADDDVTILIAEVE